MKRLNSNPNGGMFLESDDLRYMELSYIETFSAIMNAFHLTAPYQFIIFGCQVTSAGLNWNLSAGAACFNGEICIVPAQVIAKDNAETFYLEATAYNDPAGDEEFADGTIHSTYQDVRGLIKSTAFPPAGGIIELIGAAGAVAPYATLPHLNQYVGRGEWIDLPASNYEPGFQQATQKFQYKLRGNMVEFRGQFAHGPSTSISTNSKVATMPAGLFPAGIQSFIIEGASGKTYMEIRAAGEIYVRGDIVPVTFNTATGPYMGGSYPLV